MKILILGSGVIGVTTAWWLARRGHQVIVVERAPSAGQATSFANGGQLSYCYTDALASPAILPKLHRLIAGRDPSFRIKPSTDPELLAWGLRFLRNCTRQRAAYNTANILRLALYSRHMLAELLAVQPVTFAHRRSGKLHLYADAGALEAAARGLEAKNAQGCRQVVLDRAGCLAQESALIDWPDPIAGGIYSPLDESGDAHLFTTALAKVCQHEHGVRFIFGAEARRLEVRGGRIHGVEAGDEHVEADAFVLALGAYSPLLMRTLGFRLPVYPLKGYSITVPARPGAPGVSITDTTRKMVYCTLGERLRVAGMAELYGYDETLREDRLQSLLDAARRGFPRAGAYERVLHRWAGFRPATPDSAPVLGTTGYENLFLNTGQGMLGWTLACGSAAVVADIIEGREPAIDLSGLTAARFET